MKETIKQTIGVIADHPKTTVAVTGFFTSNVWLDYGAPIIQGVTSIVGLLVLIALLFKHVLDIKKSFSSSE
jgi:hypothetical protein|tara:strand:- start:10114 stop:10326 length:213 start_codon:yes stop_codon:yes gene_type:complete